MRRKQARKPQINICGMNFELQMGLLVRRVSAFMGMDVSSFARLAIYEKMYRHAKEGFLQHRLLSQPITEEEKVVIIKQYEEGRIK